MDQRFLFPPPDSEPTSSSPLVPVDAAPVISVPSERYYQTQVYRLPHLVPQTPQRIIQQPLDRTSGRALVHWLLLVLTALTTTLAGVIWFNSFTSGMVYSFTVLVILAAHEMGHYIACRWYGVDATLPYFIPFFIPPIGPIPLLPQIGTFGAFIKIRSAIPSRRALFDIGIAGPLAGFVFALPAAFIAHYFAQPAPPVEPGMDVIVFQDPLLFKFFQLVLRLPSNLELNPVMLGVWIGALMTALNLMPVGQLDGGHVTYSIFGRRGHRAVAVLSYVSVIALTAYSLLSSMGNWVLYAVILTLMLRVGHPPVVDEEEPLGLSRKIVAVIGLMVFILCFMPFPISL